MKLVWILYFKYSLLYKSSNTFFKKYEVSLYYVAKVCTGQNVLFSTHQRFPFLAMIEERDGPEGLPQAITHIYGNFYHLPEIHQRNVMGLCFLEFGALKRTKWEKAILHPRGYPCSENSTFLAIVSQIALKRGTSEREIFSHGYTHEVRSRCSGS